MIWTIEKRFEAILQSPENAANPEKQAYRNLSHEGNWLHDLMEQARVHFFCTFPIYIHVQPLTN